MTPGSPEAEAAHRAAGDRGGVAPVLVLGLGNVLLRDDGVGPRLLRDLAVAAGRWGRSVEFVEGGTQGLALLGVIERRSAVLVLDAVALGREPGALHVLRDEQVFAAAPPDGGSAHEGNAGELLRAAALAGDLPSRLVVVGIEPADLGVGLGLSPAVERALPDAARAASWLLEELAAGAGSAGSPAAGRSEGMAGTALLG